MVARPCIKCGRLTDGGTRCREHALPVERRRVRNRPSARQRGYDTQHDKTRALLLPKAIGTPCPRCGEPMLAGQELHLGHTVARSVDPHSRADRIEHARCNERAGAS